MTNKDSILLCTDLDRTLLPNGEQPESPNARIFFQQLVNQPEVKLAYVSGRDKNLLLEAIAEYDLPVPDYAIADVGSSIFFIENNQWQLSSAWHTEIGRDWNGKNHKELQQLLADIPDLQLQEAEKQNTYKLSYYSKTSINTDKLCNNISHIFQEQQIAASIIWSIDETSNTGLLDILPASANKLHAINFLISQENFEFGRCVFAGDSGNDLAVLASPLNAILVKNATNDVKQQALAQAKTNQTEQCLYFAKGGFLDMNGNYAAGILEGVAEYFPETINLIQQAD